MLTTALLTLSFGVAGLTPLQTLAAGIASHEEARARLSVESQMLVKASAEEHKHDWKRYNEGVEELRKRKASDAERIAFAKSHREGATVRHQERVWSALAPKERDLMIRFAFKFKGPTILQLKEAADMVVVSEQARKEIESLSNELTARNRKEADEYRLKWRMERDAAKTLEQIQAFEERMHARHAKRVERFASEKQSLESSILAKLTPAQRKRWNELTTIPMS